MEKSKEEMIFTINGTECEPPKVAKKILFHQSGYFYDSFGLEKIWQEHFEQLKRDKAKRLEKKDINWYRRQSKDLKAANLCLEYSEPNYVYALIKDWYYTMKYLLLKSNEFANYLTPVTIDFESGGYYEADGSEFGFEKVMVRNDCSIGQFTYERIVKTDYSIKEQRPGRYPIILVSHDQQCKAQLKIFRNYVNGLN